ncbi:nucleotidyltransferase domain-containing protein [Adhaeribacter arboris]|uniref:nucleotidyltransferase domain-containing protein n=1 Tax=Adhaeribacter arboris TaxID=2072846 RepID=UPI0018EC03AF|nr:nucleotidyltransferase domain-containing protein [Adhaeribacter arboris]
MDLKSSIEIKSDEFIALCKTHDVASLYAFGSSTNKTFDESKSDIDLLIELRTEDPMERGEKLMDLWEKLKCSSKGRLIY